MSSVPLPQLKPQQLFGTHEVRLGLLRQCQEVVRVRLAGGFQFSLPLEAFQPELAERLQHDEPGFFPF